MGGCVASKFLVDNCTDRLRVQSTISQFYTTTISEDPEGTATTISEEQEDSAITISEEQEGAATIIIKEQEGDVTNDTQNGSATDDIRNDAAPAATLNDADDEEDSGAQIAVDSSIASVDDARSTDSGSEASIVVTAL